MRDDEIIDLYYRSGLLDWRSEEALNNKKNENYGTLNISKKILTAIPTVLRNFFNRRSKRLPNINNEFNDVLTIVSRIENKLDRIDLRLGKLEKRNKPYNI